MIQKIFIENTKLNVQFHCTLYTSIFLLGLLARGVDSFDINVS